MEEEINTNTKRVELNGEEIHIHFSSTYSHFWVRNDGKSTVLMSLSPNISEGKDGVIEVPAGSSAGTEQGTNNRKQDLYIIGNGKVQVMGTEAPNNPFKEDVKGGGNSDGSIDKNFISNLLYGGIIVEEEA